MSAHSYFIQGFMDKLAELSENAEIATESAPPASVAGSNFDELGFGNMRSDVAAALAKLLAMGGAGAGTVYLAHNPEMRADIYNTITDLIG